MSQTVYGYIRVSSKDQNVERQRKGADRLWRRAAADLYG